ncbi:hypothetical protein [Limnoglobus roseus]|uniref:WGR domain-containing protein n=1 Tax=Limnoglobus roseus TaxID=2598579 RepID=A0A5C1ACC8_9BACT|nr:hypothetical protein [Limnoglobus roseus]QEL14754.1 hypothetical protein PX52LOC_01648 [Limnoglobus roseus]
MTIVFEAGNRRAEVHGNCVQYFRRSGKKKRGLVGVWFCECETEKQARQLAQRWAFKGRLGKAVLH